MKLDNIIRQHVELDIQINYVPGINFMLYTCIDYWRQEKKIKTEPYNTNLQYKIIYIFVLLLILILRPLIYPSR